MSQKKTLQIDGIGISLSDRIVRVNNDGLLKAMLITGKRDSALTLSSKIRQMYEAEFGKSLNITTRSLAAEIYDHYLLQELTLKIEKLTGQIRPTRWMIRHMEVIDCGERSEDNNRFLWDLVSLVWRREPNEK